jgi:hypothetical protein
VCLVRRCGTGLYKCHSGTTAQAIAATLSVTVHVFEYMQAEHPRMPPVLCFVALEAAAFAAGGCSPEAAVAAAASSVAEVAARQSVNSTIPMLFCGLYVALRGLLTQVPVLLRPGTPLAAGGDGGERTVRHAARGAPAAGQPAVAALAAGGVSGPLFCPPATGVACLSQADVRMLCTYFASRSSAGHGRLPAYWPVHADLRVCLRCRTSWTVQRSAAWVAAHCRT